MVSLAVLLSTDTPSLPAEQARLQPMSHREATQGSREPQALQCEASMEVATLPVP